MVRVDLKHIYRQRRQSGGRVIEYHSIRGVKGSTFWRSTDDVELGSQEYVDAYRAAKRRPVVSKVFGGIITAYLDSGEFRALAPRTKADYRRWCDEIRKKFGDAPIDAFRSPKIRQVAMRWRDRWTGRNALYAWTVLRRIVTWAYDAGMLDHHHLKGGSRGLYRASRAEIVWTDDDISTFCDGASEWLARLLTLACETGFRPGDLVKLTRANVHKTPEGRQISVRTGKSRGRSIAAVPVTETAAQIIDSTPADRLLILTNEKGTALSEEWASKAVKKRARSAGLDERLRLYDARGTAVTRLYRAGADLSQLSRHFGWQPTTAAEMLRHYATLDPAATDEVLHLLERKSVEKGVETTRGDAGDAS